MQNKKGQAAMEFLMTYGWAILAAIIAIGVLAYFGVFSGGNKYIITEIQCSNITFTEDIPFPLHLICAMHPEDKTCMQRAMRNCVVMGGELWKDDRFAFTEYCIIKNITQTKEVCNETEVYEISIPQNVMQCQDAYKGCSDYCFELRWETKDRIKADNCVLDCERKYCVELYTTISKRKIGSEWLLNNCYWKGSCTGNFEQQADCVAHNPNENNWKCGKYTVKNKEETCKR